LPELRLDDDRRDQQNEHCQHENAWSPREKAGHGPSLAGLACRVNAIQTTIRSTFAERK